MHNLVMKLQLSYDTPYSMFPALSASAQSKSPSFSLLVPPFTTYSLSLYISIDEAWQRPNSNIA